MLATRECALPGIRRGSCSPLRRACCAHLVQLAGLHLDRFPIERLEADGAGRIGKRPEATGSRCANGTRDNAGRPGRGSGILHGEWERGEREGRKPVLVMAQALTTRIERQ